MKSSFVYFCKFFAFPFTSLFTKRIKGKENIPQKGSFILASNHINSLDQWFVANALKERVRALYFLVAMDSFKTLLQSGLLYYLADVLVVNRKTVDREKVIGKLIEAIKKKKIAIFFPEGDTNRRKELLKGKTGVAALALKTGAPVIPFGMRGAKRSLGRIIEIGKPLYFEKEQRLAKEAEESPEKYRLLLRETTNRIMREISSLCQKPYNY